MTDNKESNIWYDDKLGRKVDADFLESFLTGVVETRKKADEIGSFVLNINSNWGGGKTFFLERFGKQLKENGYIVCHINAWVSDYTDDPLIPVMSAIDKSLVDLLPKSEDGSKIIKQIRSNIAPLLSAVVRGVGKRMAKKWLDEGVDEVVNIFSGTSSIDGNEVAPVSDNQGADTTTSTREKSDSDSTVEAALGEAISDGVNTLDGMAKTLIDNYLKTDQSLKAFKNGLGQAIKAVDAVGGGNHSPFFILVDELDRCRPDYAIAMLERIKHLFEVENIVFVLATDTTQLQHSITAVYGSEFDSQRYLHRFIDQTYTLSNPTMKGIIDYRISNSGWDFKKLPTVSDNLNLAIETIFTAFNVNARDAHSILDSLNNLCSTLSGGNIGINIYCALAHILAQRSGIDISRHNDATTKFVTEKCDNSVKVRWKSQIDEDEMDLKEFLLLVLRFSFYTENEIIEESNAGERKLGQNEFFSWIFQTELNTRRFRNERNARTREYARLITNCGRLSSL